MLLFHRLRKLYRKFSFLIFANDNKWYGPSISQVSKQKEDMEMRKKFEGISVKVCIEVFFFHLFCASLVWASGLKDLYLAYRDFSLSTIWVGSMRQEVWIDQETGGWEHWAGTSKRVSKLESKPGVRRGKDVIPTYWSLGSMPCLQLPLPSFLPSISSWSYKQGTNLKLPPHPIPQSPPPLQVLPENIDLMVYFS